MKLNKQIKTTMSLAAAMGTLALASSANAATIFSSTFTSVGLTSTQDIDVTSSTVVDWGYYNQVDDFDDSPVIDNSKATSGIGTVTIAPGLIDNATSDAFMRYTMTFDDGSSPTASTELIGAEFGAWAAAEDNAATFTFNDLGIGTHTVSVYVGHNSNDRVFDMDYTVTASGGGLSGNTVSNSISSGDLHSTYEIVFSTTDANADLELVFNSTSGGTGSGWIGGYVVETVPEPSTTALLGLGGLALILRRRK